MSSLADESFVILGSSPNQSADEVSLDLVSSLSFNSLRNATESKEKEVPTTSKKDSLQTSDDRAVIESQSMNGDTVCKSSISAKDLMIWSRPPNSHNELESNRLDQSMGLRQESSTQTDQETESLKGKKNTTSSSIRGNTEAKGGESQIVQEQEEPVPSTSKDVHPTNTTSKDTRNLAASFIMGEISADELKNNLYSQYPSIAMDIGIQDMLKLQNIAAEHKDMKLTLEKLNDTISSYHSNNLEWKESIKAHEDYLKDQLTKANKTIKMLLKENKELKEADNMRMEQINALQLAHQNDLLEYTQALSEKTALVENMRSQIEKLEAGKKKFQFPQFRNTIEKAKKATSGLDKKVETEDYLDELHYLQTRLVSSLKYIDQLELDLAIKNIQEKSLEDQLEVLSKHNKNLQIENEEHIQKIDLLQHNLNVSTGKHLQQMEDLRQTTLQEKEMILKDLQKLQQQNQELHQQHTHLLEQRQASSSGGSVPLPPTGQFYCPVCYATFTSAYNLQMHVERCLDDSQ